MILVDIYEMASYWTLAIVFQVVLGATYFLWSKQRARKPHDPLLNANRVEWKPLPLIEEDVEVEEPPLMGKIDENTLNVGATSFLSFDKEKRVLDSALQSLQKYGVGSCGPRGFYGTIDVHLDLEERLAKFLQVEETCVYSYGFSTIASAIPSYAKRGDIIFADENVWFAIQKGIEAARSTVKYFKHNNMKHLEEVLSAALKKRELNPKRRAFLIVEAIYLNTGEMVPLRRLIELANQFKIRIILDESLTIGVLGKNGRGITEHLGIPRDEIDLIVGSLEHSFATIGGFCAGTHFIVEHQRLSGLGYCFSASLPPMLTQAAITGLDILEENPSILRELDENSCILQKSLSQLQHYRLSGVDVSPVKHLYLKSEGLDDIQRHKYLRRIANYCLEKGVALAVAAYLRDVDKSCHEPSIRIASSRKLSDGNIELVCKLLDEAYESVGPKDF